jgi:hypothetical protein
MAGSKSLIDPMKIRLVRTGGFIPITKAAEVEADLSEHDLASLLNIIKSSPSAPRVKDGNHWELIVGDIVIPIDPEKVPDEHKALFEKLKSDLKVVK